MTRFSWPAVAGYFQFGTRDLIGAIVVVALALACYMPRSSGRAETGRELDLAIQGKGYFAVRQFNTGLPGYTRNGRLSLNAHGQLIVGRPIDGWIIQPEMTFPADHQEILIAQDGTVAYGQLGNDSFQHVGQLQLATFIAPEHLKEIAPDIYQSTQDAGTTMICNPGVQGTGLIQQGRLESPPLLSRVGRPDLWSCVVVGLAILAIREVRKLRDEVRRSREADVRLHAARFVEINESQQNHSATPSTTAAAF